MIVRCSQCNILITKHSPFGSKSLSDQIMTIKLGDFALIFSRKYFLYALLSVFLICLYFTSYRTHDLYISQITWVDYLSDCSAEKIIRSKEDVQRVFSHKYYERVVGWEGYLMRADVNEGWFQGAHAAILLVKMQPSESEIYADLVLTLDRTDFLECKDQIVLLDRGSHFSFNATLTSVADEESIHHLHAHQIRKIDGQLDIPYQMKNNFRNSAYKPSVEIVSIVDKPVDTDHDHVHYYNETFNQTLE